MRGRRRATTACRLDLDFALSCAMPGAPVTLFALLCSLLSVFDSIRRDGGSVRPACGSRLFRPAPLCNRRADARMNQDRTRVQAGEGS